MQGRRRPRPKIGDYFQSRAFQAGAEQRTGDVPELLSQELQSFQRAEEVAVQLQKDLPRAADKELGATLDRLSDAYLQSDQNEDGLSCAMRVLELRRDILSRSPQDKSARRNLTVALEKVGSLLNKDSQGF